MIFRLLTQTNKRFRSYRGLTPKTRMLIGGGVMAYALFGILLSDRAEIAFGFTPTEEDKKNLRDAVPKIHLVEREKK
jgi:hypothetical protein